MQHSDLDSTTTSNPFLYWATWLALFLGSKAAGVIKAIEGFLPPEIKAPVHDIWYLPQLKELIPALVTAGCCIILSAILNRLIGLVWDKLFSKRKIN